MLFLIIFFPFVIVIIGAALIVKGGRRSLNFLCEWCSRASKIKKSRQATASQGVKEE